MDLCISWLLRVFCVPEICNFPPAEPALGGQCQHPTYTVCLDPAATCQTSGQIQTCQCSVNYYDSNGGTAGGSCVASMCGLVNSKLQMFALFYRRYRWMCFYPLITGKYKLKR